MKLFVSICLVLSVLVADTAAYTLPLRTTTNAVTKSSSLFPQPKSRAQQQQLSSSSLLSAALSPPSSSNDSDSEGFNTGKVGWFSFKTKFGYLNPYAIFYGVTSILLGIPWFIALNLCQLMYAISDKFDKMKWYPSLFSHMWGVALMNLTRSNPKITGQEILDKFMSEGRAAMFVANHNSFMDIPFVGTSLGWRNYKMISKVELGKVPILGRSIKVGGHVMVDRSSRRSQLNTLKSGMKWLKDGIHLVTFPEGTRSKNGRLLPFKNGAFKMAHKVGAPIVPISIVHANVVNPPTWIFPRQPSRGTCRVVIHEPIESNDKTEAELAAEVRKKIIEGLPEDQRPLDE
jgi:1-acyl-sn-glycerol-3-phosphate acyltransferase